MLRQNLAKLRQRFFGAVLFVAGDQHDVLALTGTVVAFVVDPLIAGLSSRAYNQERK